MRLDDLLGVRHIVTNRQRESSGIDSDPLVLPRRELDQVGAPQAATLAPKRGERILLPLPSTTVDRFIYVPEQRLVPADPLLRRFVHYLILAQRVSGQFMWCSPGRGR